MRGRSFNKLNPPQLLILIFIFFALLGTLLLKLPISTTDSITLVDSLFTATSAMTVTGLIVVDTGTAFTLFGQIIILLLIQVGGIGIMTFAVLIFIMLGKKIGFQERLVLQHALNQSTVGGIVLLVKRIVTFAFIIEGIAVVLLSYRWIPEYGWMEGFYYSVFHAISSFNNAGFSIWSDSLMQYVGDPVVNIVISFLFIIGGIGFTVLTDLWYTKKFRKLNLHTKMMLFGTLAINMLAMFVLFVLEYSNPNTLANLSLVEKLWASYFQAVTTRTAGFNSIDIGSMETGSIIWMLLLMFIGAGSTSTGGGIKLTTFIIIILAVNTFIKGKQEIVVFKRSIHQKYVLKALAISTISILFIFVSLFILSITEQTELIVLLFEVISAFGTVGLSMGITPELTDIGKGVIIFIMLLGKLGPLTLAYSLAKPRQAKVRYPNEDLLTG
ncbi:TrkH family potassium uptake protein [Sutcliffiella horikoshii]|uniref:TrkH family potassium uptake protein n=1 Tax=Sutcliffiella horikoshii TaxID=79883 RepID=UPI00203D769E|nr:TrkH family potassium uptake protein [Sutcliffiella horikoshii]MCM3617077.1 TrkH family potassium uptake protein [Sutcliffiella horikoshii]